MTSTEGSLRFFAQCAITFLVAIWSPLASVALTFAIAAFYLPSAALFDR